MIALEIITVFTIFWANFLILYLSICLIECRLFKGVVCNVHIFGANFDRDFVQVTTYYCYLLTNLITDLRAKRFLVTATLFKNLRAYDYISSHQIRQRFDTNNKTFIELVTPF